MTKRKQKQLENLLGSTKGRFFGLATRNGEVHNAQLIETTPCFIRIRDRNTGSGHTYRKTSVSALTLKGQTHSF